MPTITAQAVSPHLKSPPKLEQAADTVNAKTKKHWWTRLTTLFKSRPSEAGEIIQYQGMSSRPWAAIAADPPYMSNSQDLRVHHPSFGIGGSY